MPSLAVWCGIIAAFLFRESRRPAQFWAAVAVSLLGLLSWQVMRYAALRAAARRRHEVVSRMRASSRPPEEIAAAESQPIRLTLGDTQEVPDWLTYINMASALSALALLAWALVVRLA